MKTVKFDAMSHSDWSRFLDGGVYLNVERDEYLRFAALCVAANLRWENGKSGVDWNPFEMYCHGSITVRLAPFGIAFAGADDEEKKENEPMEIKVNLENLSEDERARLLALIEKANTPQVRPSRDDVVWAVNGSGVVFSNLLKSMKPQRLEYLKATNRLFHTREEAEFAAERQKVIGELETLSDGNMTDSYFIIGIKVGECCPIGAFSGYLAAIAPFKSRYSASVAIQKVGADRIKKYLFSVKPE